MDVRFMLAAGGGYRMLNRLLIDNFRGFSNFEVDDLRRINVITGPNASGKTALLEAILVGVRALPQAIGQITLSRNLPGTNSQFVVMNPFVPTAVNPAMFRAQWDNLFRNWATGEEIKIEYDDSDGNEYSVKLHYARTGDAIVSAQIGTPSAADSALIPFIIEREKNNDQSRISISLNALGQVTYDVVNAPLGPVAAFFPSNPNYPESDNVIWFSALSTANKEKRVIELLCKEFPQIKGLSILAPNGIQGIWAELGDKKLPLTLLSSGINKIFSLLLAVVSYENGIIIIDEIENGIFHDRYSEMWSVIYSLICQQNNQLFVSTHSLEELKALAPVMKKTPDDFCLIRMSEQKGTPIARQISGRALRSSLAGNSEVR